MDNLTNLVTTDNALVEYATNSPASPVDLYIESLPSLRSRRTMTQCLARITDILNDREASGDQKENWRRAHGFDWAALRVHHVAAIKARIGTNVSKATANKMLSAVRGVLQKARMMKLISPEDYSEIGEIKGFKTSSELRGRALAEDELLALALVCRADKTPAGCRDAALMAIAYGTGLRRFEIAALNVSDWNPQDQSIRIKHGKGDKVRTVYLSDSGRRCLDRWLAVQPTSEVDDSPLFLPVDKSGKIIERRLTDQAIYNMLEKRRIQAGIKAFSPHDMRRSFISDLLDAGADLSAVAGLAGHASVTTTARYDRRGERAKKAAAAKLKCPF